MKKYILPITVLIIIIISVVMIITFSDNNKKKPSAYRINQNLVPIRSVLPGIKHGPPREIGVVTRPDGRRGEFVVDEVIFNPSHPGELDSFLNLYGGKVLCDGKPIKIDGAPGRKIPETETQGSYLIKVDLNRSSIDDYAENVKKIKSNEQLSFSNEKSVRLFSLLLREFQDRKISVNFITNAASVPEHPLDSRGATFADASTWWWMDDCNVIPAWNYLRYQGVPPVGEGTWTPVIIAIVDGGFDLDENTGLPKLGNIDYHFLGNKPWQADLIDFDGTAGGENLNVCSKGSSCPWHGQSVFGVACAYPRNNYGGAGTGGDVVLPMLLKVDGTFYSQALGIRSAVVNGAEVINMSFGGDCGSFWSVCESEFIDGWGGLYNIGIQDMKDALILAKGWNVASIASAGNDTIRTTGLRIFPLSLTEVIGVGSIDRNKKNVYNYGELVDIWAPTHILSTVTRESSNRPNDNNDYGIDEVDTFGGTSASAPFVSGIVGLMKALDHSVHPEDIKSILQTTANQGYDPLVTWGYVDALKAVKKVRLNKIPSIRIKTPLQNADISWISSNFFATVVDPDPGAGLPLFNDKYLVQVVSDRDGIIGTYTRKTTMNGVEGFGGTLGQLSLGVHRITATVTDPFGASASETITVTSMNRPPSINIIQPLTGIIVRNHEEVSLEAYAPDPEDGSLASHWTSNIDGDLGTFYKIQRTFSIGDHLLTATVTDSKGLSRQAITRIKVIAREGRPDARITSPTGGNFSLDQIITFKGTGTDIEDGILPESSLSWASDIDGFLGTGNTINVRLSGPRPGPSAPEFTSHKITLTVTDSDRNKSQYSVLIWVGRLR